MGRWNIVFWLTAGILCAGVLVFLVFGTGIEVPWAQALTTDKKNFNTKSSYENSAYATTDTSMDDVRNASK